MFSGHDSERCAAALRGGSQAQSRSVAASSLTLAGFDRQRAGVLVPPQPLVMGLVRVRHTRGRGGGGGGFGARLQDLEAADVPPEDAVAGSNSSWASDAAGLILGLGPPFWAVTLLWRSLCFTFRAKTNKDFKLSVLVQRFLLYTSCDLLYKHFFQPWD